MTTTHAAPDAHARAEPATARSGGGLAVALVVYLLAVVAVVTLAPFEFAWPERLRIWAGEWTVLDVVANVLLFVPLGFVGAMAWARVASGGAWRALVLGAAVSVAIESAQLFAPERYTSPWDVLTNAAGAWLGARALAAVRGRLDPATVVGRLALDLPLMGLVYLLVPLGWSSALTVGAGPMRPLLLLCLGLFGASVLGAVQRRHFGPAGVFSPLGMAAAAAAWLVVAALPALNAAPREVALVALLVAVFTWHRAGGGARGTAPGDAGRERRFELQALLRAAPFLAAYLLLLPLTEPSTARLSRHVILRIVETMTAFTVLGYAVAEAMGRRELPYREAAVRVAAVALPVAVALAVVRAAGMPPADETPRIVAALVAALYGGWLYDVQRRNVREVLGRG
ncbi:MAG TPA: VanZ family protein [Gemmatimonadaceae bacterium]|nr:VanZ family protein [Gemmatimonadaceae bacterium]